MPAINRRRSLQLLGLSAAAVALRPHVSHGADESLYRAKHGKIRQSVVPWCFRPMPVPELIGHAAKLGLESVELVDPKFWPEIKMAGLTVAIAGSHGFAKGFAHVEEHAECLKVLRGRIDQAAEFGCKSVITFSGFRRGLTTDDATKNMIAGLKQIVGYAEQKDVTLCLEMLNSRVAVEMKGHPDYFCDDIDHSVEICKQIGSPRLKVLFDIYHVQIMQGDVIVRIRQHKDWIGHYHTAGVPGRNEIDDQQEINYSAIMREIVATGYRGFVGQEFIPTREPVGALAQAVKICDVA
jgi:hydroxypyruvate isomerase